MLGFLRRSTNISTPLECNNGERKEKETATLALEQQNEGRIKDDVTIGVYILMTAMKTDGG